MRERIKSLLNSHLPPYHLTSSIPSNLLLHRTWHLQERNFHIFHQLLAVPDGLLGRATSLQLPPPDKALYLHDRRHPAEAVGEIGSSAIETKVEPGADLSADVDADPDADSEVSSIFGFSAKGDSLACADARRCAEVEEALLTLGFGSSQHRPLEPLSRTLAAALLLGNVELDSTLSGGKEEARVHPRAAAALSSVCEALSVPENGLVQVLLNPRTSYCAIPAACCLLLESHYSLLTPSSLLVTAHCFRLAANCLLLTALYSLFSTQHLALEGYC